MKKIIISLLVVTVILGAMAFFVLRSNAPSGNPDSDKETLAHSTDSLTHSETDMGGVIITEINAREYQQLIKDSCNVRLLVDSTKFKETADSLTLVTQEKEVVLLNLPYDEEVATDFSIKWQYDCFDAKHKLSFFSFIGYESWGYYAVNNTGCVSRFYANDKPVFCKGTDLFATWFEDPYEGRNTLNIYKILPDGRLCEIVIIELGEYDSAYNPIWVGKTALVAAKYQPDTKISGYIHIDLTPKAMNDNTPLPIDSFHEYNKLVREIKSDTKNQ